MPHTVLRLLGAPRIESGGEPLVFDTRKATALLAYLAITGRYHGRNALAGLSWPEYGQKRARAALRRTLSALGRARSEGWLIVDREGAGLDRADLWLDVDRFEEFLAGCREHGHPATEVCPGCLAPLAEAVALYRDDFMAGFGLRDSAAFDDWQFFLAEDLRRGLAGALERLSRGLAAGEDWEPAVSHARRWLALDPLHEPAHRWLMQLYAWSGARAAAVRQYRECARILENELGVAPLEETTAVHEAIKENAPPSPPTLFPEGSPPGSGRAADATAQDPPPVPPPGPSPRGPRLVGRGDEWSALLRAYGAASGGGRVVIIEGEGGIGKTTLAEAFLRQIEGGGAATVTARCYPGETDLAYGPFVEGLSAALTREDAGTRLAGVPGDALAEAARLVPGLAGGRWDLPSPPTPGAVGAQRRLFTGVEEVLLALCAGPAGGIPAGVLFIDDAHWADASSLDLLFHLIRRLGPERRLLVLLTWRGEQVPRDHRLRGLLAEARRAGTGEVLRPRRLDRAAVEELAAPLTQGVEDLGRRLHDETEGLPLFVGEYLEALGQGTLAVANESWTLPGGVRDLLHGKLETVGETGRQVLGAAAAIGRSFDFDTVREASGRGEEEVVEALEELGAGGLVHEVDAWDGTPVYDFGHQKLRETVYEETSLARRRLLHRRVAEALVRRAGRFQEAGPLDGQIARHYALAGRGAEAADHFERAGRHAHGLYANAEALSHFGAALALGHPDVVGLREAVGDMHTLLGGYGEAIASYEAARSPQADGRLAAVERKLGDVYGRLGEWDPAERHLGAALAALGDAEGEHRGERAGLLAELALLSHRKGLAGPASERAALALELSEASGDERALARAHNAAGILAGGAGDVADARTHLERSLELAEALDDPAARVAALNNLAKAHGGAGELNRALEATEAALARCVSLGDQRREAALHNNLADLLHAAGREEESRSHLREAVAIFAEVGEDGVLQPGIWKLAEW